MKNFKEIRTSEPIEEKYTISIGFKGVDEAIRRLEESLKPTSVLCKSISRDADNVVPEFRKMQQAMKIISAQWDEIHRTIAMSESVKHDKVEK